MIKPENVLQNHSLVHSRRHLLLCGTTFIGFGFAMVGIGLHWTQCFYITAFTWEVLATVTMVRLLSKPCKCGNVVLLTVEGHRRRMQQRRAAILVVLNLLLLTAISAAILHTTTFGWTLFALYGGCFIGLGICAMIMGVLNKVPSTRVTICMSAAELNTINAMTGETEDELHKLIDCHLRLGNFEEADQYSRKLLCLVEPTVDS